MGYKRDKVYKLIYEGDHELAGLEVRLRPVPIGQFFELDLIFNGHAPDRFTSMIEANAFLFDSLGDALASWNLEDDAGQPVPADRAGVLAQDKEFVFLLANDWMTALRTVNHPLPKPSTNTSEGSTGETSLEEMLAEIPSQSITESHGNSTTTGS